MKNTAAIGQLLLRLALGIGFLIPVLDRLGFWGSPGSGATWGDWKHFIDYTNTLIPFANRQVANVIGIIATLGEFVFGILLIVGYRIKEAGLGAAVLTLCFGLCMAIFVSIKAPFNYPVFVFTGAALVLSALDHYEWSLDSYIQKRDL
ncbi:putative membrane protein YphA (DoxX/SURF4 family) [Mucilaginibacter sp. SG538B]|uniref:DoxX family membrane protein n=1 Tax=Mucilaginibacter sp. SG538B TaxID=2587021 RepID=UPI00159DBBE7|nr:DoxX family membrane protein [Mucilaginibacter sp. SG538B]NVM67283.1 putative membrane protein YphA (DoxX/SURF4 family) [Mucilaginibacter sp. SG538B]